MVILDYAPLLFLLSQHNTILMRKALFEALCDQASVWLKQFLQMGFASVSFKLAKEFTGIWGNKTWLPNMYDTQQLSHLS